MTSRGATRYDRTFMEGFVRPGPGMANWTSRTNYPAWGIIPTGDTEMSFFIQRHYGQPTHHLQRMALRRDGFASVHAPYAGGDMSTKPLRFSGKQLVLNCATSAAGSVWVELLDATNAVIPGYGRADCDEIIGDSLDRVVSWHGNSDLSALAGQPVETQIHTQGTPTSTRCVSANVTAASVSHTALSKHLQQTRGYGIVCV